MRELALHILDVIENAVRAGAHTIRVTVSLDPDKTRLMLGVEDDGPGLPGSPRDALNPFFTTKPGKRTGLGLSLFQLAAEQSGGAFSLGASALGGVAVQAEFGYRHIDRTPLGDMAGTLMTVMLSYPEGRIICELRGPDDAVTLDSTAFTPGVGAYKAAVAFAEAVKTALAKAGIGQ